MLSSILKFNFRNGNKKGAVELKHLFILVFKIIMDLMSRILLFSAWMYTSNNGQFSTWMTVIAYVLFNVIFNSNNDFGSMQYWIGKSNET